MKNFSVTKKLICSFLVLTIILCIVGATGLINNYRLNQAADEMFYRQIAPFPDLVGALMTLQEMRLELLVTISSSGDTAAVSASETLLSSAEQQFRSYIDNYLSAVECSEGIRLIDEAITFFDTEFMPEVNIIITQARAGATQETLNNILHDIQPTFRAIRIRFDEVMASKVADAAYTNQENNSRFLTTLTLMIITIALAVAAAVTLAIYISLLISKPVAKISDVLSRFGTTGDSSLTDEEHVLLSQIAEQKDEIGTCTQSLLTMVKHIETIETAMRNVASGDLTAEFNALSEHDIIGNALEQMKENLGKILGEIKTASVHVSSGAKQLSAGTQSLAQSATEQASAVQQLSESINEVADMTKENTKVAEQAAALANSIMDNAERGSTQMNQMIQAVQDINDASTSIGKIIKTIDEIAFQTNILALNAAVEAARAGQHGKGFAVVAEEVRTLASKSAEAAKETGDIIQDSMKKAELGVKIAGGTAESLNVIVSNISESSVLMDKIAAASIDQSKGIEQITIGIDQVAQVVTQTAATAEESAAASIEMDAQSTLLNNLATQFKIADDSMGAFFTSHASPAAIIGDSLEEDTDPLTTFGIDFGKY